MGEDVAENSRTDAIDEILGLCADIEDAVRNAQWDEATALLARRHAVLETEFAAGPATAEDVERLYELAKRILAFDQTLMPGADAARALAADELKKLRRSREAAGIYRQNAG